MKMNINKIVAAFTIGVFAVPLFASAQLNTNATANGQACARIENAKEATITRMQERLTTLENRRAQTKNAIQTRRTEHKSRLTELRNTWDENRDQIYQKLQERAQTESQTQAVANFQETIETAVTVRRTAIDQAIETYWAGVDSLYATRVESTDDITKTYQSAVQTAFANALEACGNDESAVQIRATLTSALRTARQNF